MKIAFVWLTIAFLLTTPCAIAKDSLPLCDPNALRAEEALFIFMGAPFIKLSREQAKQLLNDVDIAMQDNTSAFSSNGLMRILHFIELDIPKDDLDLANQIKEKRGDIWEKDNPNYPHSSKIPQKSLPKKTAKGVTGYLRRFAEQNAASNSQSTSDPNSFMPRTYNYTNMTGHGGTITVAPTPIGGSINIMPNP